MFGMFPVKLSLLILSILFAPLLCRAQNEWGELKGVVKYTTANGQRANDGGAEIIIYLIDSVKFPADRYRKQREEDSLVNNSFLAEIYYEEWAHTPVGKVQKKMVRNLKSLNAWPEEKLHELDDLAASVIKAREARLCARATTDQNGNYSAKLHVGYYGLIFRSRHLHTRTKSEMNGNIMLDDAVIRPGQLTTKNEDML